MRPEEDTDGRNGLYKAINCRGGGGPQNQCSSRAD